jgi:hypothetical protein
MVGLPLLMALFAASVIGQRMAPPPSGA